MNIIFKKLKNKVFRQMSDKKIQIFIHMKILQIQKICAFLQFYIFFHDKDTAAVHN
jgi:hypothetical protein